MSRSRLTALLSGAVPRDADIRRSLALHTARTSLRSNRISAGLILIIGLMLKDTGVGASLWFWCGMATVIMLVYEIGVNWSIREAVAGRWSNRHATVLGTCFLLTGFVWGSPAIFALPGPEHAGDQAVVAAVVMMGIAANLVFGSASPSAFHLFHAAVAISGVTGFVIGDCDKIALLIAFAAIGCLPLQLELTRHVTEATVIARRNASLVEELRRNRAEIEQMNVRLTEANVELSHRATRDPLTGLANRDLFEEYLTATLTRARGQGLLVSVLYFDLDRFKAVNDTHGHATGDALLKAVAGRVGNQLRDGELLARRGGDEFTAVAVTATGPEALALAERICRCFDEPFALEGLELRVSTSIGLAADTGREDPEQLIAGADTALYRAKQRGRNRVEALLAA